MQRLLTPLVCLVPALALAQSAGGPLVGTSLSINEGPGDQTDPRLSGTRVVYTHQASRGESEVRHHDLLTGADGAIPALGAYDSLADVYSTQVVFTRTTSTNFVYRFDLAQGGYAEELAPRPDVDRRTPAVGGHSVAWQELGYTARGASAEIFVYHQGTQALTRLTTDTRLDRTPAVSPDGTTVVWTKCQSASEGCDIWMARESGANYTLTQLTGAEGEEGAPDTDGERVAYVSRTGASGDPDIVWRRLDGGEPQRLVLPGADTNPSLAGSLIVFEHSDSPGSYDIMAYDLRTQLLYRLTQTASNKSLSDVSVGSDGLVRVVWAERANGDSNVRGYSFRLPTQCTPAAPAASPEALCASPGTRQLLGLLDARAPQSGESTPISSEISGQGTGILCVDNGTTGPRATSGYVWLGSGLAVDASEFEEDMTTLARSVPLQGRRFLSAQAEGEAGAAFRTRLYGPLSCDVAAQDAGFSATEVRYGRTATVRSPDSAPSDTASATSGASVVLQGDEGRPSSR